MFSHCRTLSNVSLCFVLVHSMRVCVCVRVCVRACMCVCVHVCMYNKVHALGICVFVSVHGISCESCLVPYTFFSLQVSRCLRTDLMDVSDVEKLFPKRREGDAEGDVVEPIFSLYFADTSG